MKAIEVKPMPPRHMTMHYSGFGYELGFAIDEAIEKGALTKEQGDELYFAIKERFERFFQPTKMSKGETQQ